MAVVIGAILLVLLFRMPAGLPSGKKDAKFSEVISKNRNVNWLSAARVFLFGARDVWFVVGIPIYFYSVLSDGTPESNRTAFFIIGIFMAVWVILYGAVQASAPQLLRAKEKTEAQIVGEARFLGRHAVCRALRSRARRVACGNTGNVAHDPDRGGAADLRRTFRAEFFAPLLPDPRVYKQ